MKQFTTLLILSLMFLSPVSALAETNAGVGPSNFFYIFDTTFEKVGLFFTFDSEKKAQKALVYAEERLAEAEESANENNSKSVEKAMSGYEKQISLATEKSKELKDEEKAEKLLNTVSESTAKHQEVLSGVLEKVPDEAKEAILKAIEISKKGQEKALQEITILKKEVSELKDEIQELKKELGNKTREPKEDNSNEEIDKLKKEVEELKNETKKPEQKTEEKEDVSKIEKDESKIVTLPNGAIVEMDKNGNIIRTIKEAIQQLYVPPVINTEPTATSSLATEIHEIISVSIFSTFDTMTFEWETNKVSKSKVFISGGDLSSKVYGSQSGLSTRHIANVSNLNGDTNYSYEIESIIGEEVVKEQGTYSTKKIKENATLSLNANTCRTNINGTYCDVEVYYYEDGERKDIDSVTISSDDSGEFVESSYPNRSCSGGEAANSDGTQRKGNPLSCPTRPSGRDGKPVVYFTYKPSAIGSRTLTAVANGVIATTVTQGQIEQCVGQIDVACNQ